MRNATAITSAITAAAALVLLAGSCTYPEGAPPPPPDYAPSPKVTLAAGDRMDIKFFHTPELNELDLLVRPDGRIALQLVGEVRVAGRSPRELKETLTTLYEPHLKYPGEITINIKELNNRRVYVSGEVTTPGLVPLPGRLTVLEAIMEAGGFDMDKARPACTIVVRHEADQRLAYLVDLEGTLEGRPAPPFYLRPRDMIYVPRTNIANVDQYVDQYFHKIFSAALVSGLLYTTR